MIATISRQLRGRFVDILAIAVIVVLGTGTAIGIISYQRAALPSWIPVFGEPFVEFEAEFETGQAVMPGQGQAITIAGVQVGWVDSVRLEGGRAIIGMSVEPDYAELIKSDAELLLRPRTSLNDMEIDIEPGFAPEPIGEGGLIPVANTAPHVNPEEFINTLDGDTQEYLRLLLAAGAEGLRDGGGQDLGDVFRRFYPFVRDVAKLNREIALRRTSLARVIHNFGLLTDEIGRNEQIVTRWVGSSSEVLGAFADEAQSIREALQELPSTLQTTDTALTAAEEMSDELGPALAKLIPQAQALGPAMDATAEMFETTTPVIRDQVRPFTRQMIPVLRQATRGSDAFAETVRNFGSAVGELNYVFNLLAHNTGPQNPGFLFYLPWLNHNINANYMTYDAAGPMRRGTVFFTCQTGYLAEGATATQPFLRTVLRSTNTPRYQVMARQLIDRGIEPRQGLAAGGIFCLPGEADVENLSAEVPEGDDESSAAAGVEDAGEGGAADAEAEDGDGDSDAEAPESDADGSEELSDGGSDEDE